MDRPSKDSIHFLIWKLHSLTGIVPIGIFLVFHLAVNSLRTVGVLPYKLSIDLINNLPFLLWLEVGLIYVPLLFHSAVGAMIAHSARFNAFRYRYPRNWLYYLQRLTGGVVFVFLVYHFITTAGAKLWYGHHHFEAAPFLIDVLNREFESWGGRALYLVGILAASFHFANGLWSFSLSWGLVTGRRAQKNLGWAVMGVFLLLSVMGIATVAEFSLHPAPVPAATLPGGS